MRAHDPNRTLRRSGAGLFVALGAMLAGGCSSWWKSTFPADGGEVRIEGLGTDRFALDGLLPHGAYAANEADHSFYLSDVPLEDLLAGRVRNGQFMHCRLLWIPLPGRTPVDATACNLTIRYVVVSEGEVGVYGGGGFAWPKGDIGKEDATLLIEGSSLALLARSEGFTDLLTPAQLTGTIAARLDEDATRRFRRGVSQLVTDGLGATRWVNNASDALSPDQVVALALPATDASAAMTPAPTGSRSGL